MATTDKVQLPPGRERRLTALMTAMGAKEPPASQDVIGLAEAIRGCAAKAGARPAPTQCR